MRNLFNEEGLWKGGKAMQLKMKEPGVEEGIMCERL